MLKRLTWFSWTVLIILALSGVYGAQQQISSGQQHVVCDSGCGSGAITANDGGLVTLGANADAAVGDATGTVNAHLRQIAKSLGSSIAVTGTFWQATQPVSIATAPALVTSTANVGIVRAAPSSCTQSTNFTSSTVGVATGAGTSVTSTTTCVTSIYANNVTNAAVTLRVQDKTGTPIIWIGGNADFSIAPNSSVSFPVGGVTFTAGITAITGTAAAVNLQVNGLQ